MTAPACVREGSQGQEVGDLSCPMHLGPLLSAPSWLLQNECHQQSLKSLPIIHWNTFNIITSFMLYENQEKAATRHYDQLKVSSLTSSIVLHSTTCWHRMPFSFRTFNSSFKRTHNCLHTINFTTSISELIFTEYCHYIMESQQSKSRWLTPQDDRCEREAEAVRSCTSDWEAQPVLSPLSASLAVMDRFFAHRTAFHSGSAQAVAAQVWDELRSWDAGIAAGSDLTASKSAGHGNSGAKLYIHTMYVVVIDSKEYSGEARLCRYLLSYYLTLLDLSHREKQRILKV